MRTRSGRSARAASARSPRRSPRSRRGRTRPQRSPLLDQAFARPRGLALGLTGPPGAGKSTLVDALIRHWRGDARGRGRSA